MSDNIKEKMEQVIEGSQKDGSKIIKDLVVGFLIVRSKVKNGNSYVNVIPLNSSWNGFDDDHDLDANEEIVGVIPAPQGSYKVLGLFPCEDSEQEYPDTGRYGTLGYDYQGAYCPEWKKLLEEQIKNGEHLKKDKKAIIFSD